MTKPASSTEQRKLEFARQETLNEMGPELVAEMSNPLTTEIFLFENSELWALRMGEGLVKIADMGVAQAQRLMETMASQATPRIELDEDNPWLECTLPWDGSRVAGSMPPVGKVPTFNIRKRAGRAFSLDEWHTNGAMTSTQRAFLSTAIKAGWNILIAGATGCGKTTFINALLTEVAIEDPESLVNLIQEQPELRCDMPTCREFTVAPLHMKKALAHNMRRSPDRIIVGEVRGDEVEFFMQAMNTGHAGCMSTLHANDGVGALYRLEELYVGAGKTPVPRSIARSINVVVFLKKDRNVKAGRRIAELVKVKRYNTVSQEYEVEDIE